MDICERQRYRILPLVADSGDRMALHDWISYQDSYEVVANVDNPAEADFDCAILDVQHLFEEQDSLVSCKTQKQVALPFLLLVPESDALSIRSRLRDDHSDLWELVDGILEIPITEYRLAEKVEMLVRIRRLSEQRRVLSEVNRWLVEAGTVREMLPETTDIIASSDLFECTFVALVDNSRFEYVCESASEMQPADVADFHTDDYLDAVFDQGLLRIDDVTRPPFDQHVSARPSHSGMAAAISHDDTQYGVITVHFRPGKQPSQKEIDLFTELAGDIGLFLNKQELKQDLRTFKEIAERIDDPVMLQDLQGKYRVVNEALSDLADMPKAELIGKDEFAFMDEKAARTVEKMKERARGEEEGIRYEVSPSFPGLGQRTYSTIRYPHYDEKGELIGTVAICRDVTDLKEREQQLQVMDRVLRHNVNNNMTVIEGFAETIREKTSDEFARQYAETILESSENLTNTVRKERDITKFLSDAPSTETVDIVSLIQAAAESVRDEHPNADISTNLPKQCDGTATKEIGQAISELIRNAVVHSDRMRPSVDIHVESSEESVQIHVADNGPGIPEMERKVLTGEAEIEPLYHGSGLGLWLVNLIVRHSDGLLRFEENSPRGSVVSIAVPRAR